LESNKGETCRYDFRGGKGRGEPPGVGMMSSTHLPFPSTPKRSKIDEFKHKLTQIHSSIQTQASRCPPFANLAEGGAIEIVASSCTVGFTPLEDSSNAGLPEKSKQNVVKVTNCFHFLMYNTKGKGESAAKKQVSESWRSFIHRASFKLKSLN
jgi:hypothetical protein